MKFISAIIIFSALLMVASASQASPALMWTNKGYQHLPSGTHSVSYAVTSLDQLTSSVLPWDGDVAVIYIGKQMSIRGMRQPEANEYSTINELMQSSDASMVVPYTLAEGPINTMIAEKVKAAGINVKMIGCDSSEVNLSADLSAALSGAEKVIIVCGSASSAAAEVQQVAEARNTLASSGKSFLISMVNEPSQKSTISRNSRSLLQETPAPEGKDVYEVCDVVCQTQVQWLQGMLILLVLALCSCAGFTCSYFLNTPTRFQAPKEGS